MSWCLIKSEQEKFKKALREKKINPFELAEMTSEQRRTLFSKFVDPENAVNINSLYESKLLLKNQQQGFQAWAKRVLGMQPATRSDLMSKIDRLGEKGILSPKDLESFKEDLAKTRLGLNITFEEAKTINQLSEERVASRTEWEAEIKDNPSWIEDPLKTRDQWINSTKRMEFGLKQVAIENYVNDLKLKANNKMVSFREDPLRAVLNPIIESPVFFNNLFKSLMASVDNSFFGRQGIKNLFGTLSQKRIWTRNFIKSFSDIAAELRKQNIKGIRPMDFIRADVYSRPNAMNGKYKVGRYGLDVLTEEAFPTSIPERIPVLGRVFRASETAYNGGALRMRADLADLMISKMDAQGINTLNPDQAKPVGDLIGSLTGRGNLGMLSPVSSKLNFVLWSAKFLKANVDTLFSPVAYAAAKLKLGKPKTEGYVFAKKEAAMNMASIVAHVAGIMMLAKFLDPEAVEEDPRSTNFGKIKIFGIWVDITGGMGSLMTLSARMIPTKRDGVWGSWFKSSTGNWTNLQKPEYGQMDGVDMLLNALLLNKLAPFASILRDYYRGEMFGGEPFNIVKSITNSGTPLSIQQVSDVKDKGFAAIMAVTIAEFLGLGTSTNTYKDNWESKKSKEMKSFKEQVGEATFKDANEAANRAYDIWLSETERYPEYKQLSDEGKSTLKSDAREAIKTKILEEYGYTEEKETKTDKELEEADIRKSLKP